MNSSLILVGFVLKTQRQENQRSGYEWHHSSIFTDKENWPFFRGRGGVLACPIWSRSAHHPAYTVSTSHGLFFFFLRCCHSNKKTYKIPQTQKGINSNKIIHNRQKPFIYTTNRAKGEPVYSFSCCIVFEPTNGAHFDFRVCLAICLRFRLDWADWGCERVCFYSYIRAEVVTLTVWPLRVIIVLGEAAEDLWTTWGEGHAKGF